MSVCQYFGLPLYFKTSFKFYPPSKHCSLGAALCHVTSYLNLNNSALNQMGLLLKSSFFAKVENFSDAFIFCKVLMLYYNSYLFVI
jgi:hypothetical protein